jgi:hypothetical protein
MAPLKYWWIPVGYPKMAPYIVCNFLGNNVQIGYMWNKVDMLSINVQSVSHSFSTIISQLTELSLYAAAVNVIRLCQSYSALLSRTSINPSFIFHAQKLVFSRQLFLARVSIICSCLRQRQPVRLENVTSTRNWEVEGKREGGDCRRRRRRPAWIPAAWCQTAKKEEGRKPFAAGLAVLEFLSARSFLRDPFYPTHMT